MAKKICRIAFALILIAGVLADLFLLCGRMDAELRDRSVAVAVFYEDIVRLSEESGEDEELWLEAFARSGVGYIVFDSDYEPEELEQTAVFGMKAAAHGDIEGILEGDWAFVVPREDEPLPKMAKTDLVVMKNEDRSAAVLPEGFRLADYKGRMVKAVYSFPDYVNRYKDDLAAQEIENVFFRAITDRGARLVLLRPITYADYSPVLEISAYEEMLANLAERVEKRGYSFGGEYSVLEAHDQSPVELWLAAFVPIAIWAFLITRFRPFRALDKLVVTLFGLVCVAVAIHFAPGLSAKLLAFGSMLGFALAWIYFIHGHFILRKNGRLKNPFAAYLLCLAAVLIWGFMGGLSVAAIQTDMPYLMGETIFSGVKLSMNLPIFVCAIVFALPIVRRFMKGGYSKKQLLSMLPALAVVLAALAVLVHRSGQTDNTVSELENRLRVAFEYAFYARPRTKEILVAVPFMSLLFVMGRREDSMLHLIGGLCCALECVSLVNTFCHGVASLHVSLIRGSLSALFGGIIGLVIIALFVLFERLISKKRGGEGT